MKNIKVGLALATFLVLAACSHDNGLSHSAAKSNGAEKSQADYNDPQSDYYCPRHHDSEYNNSSYECLREDCHDCQQGNHDYECPRLQNNSNNNNCPRNGGGGMRHNNNRGRHH